MDIGRIYVGTAITDKYISQPKLLKTLTLETGLKSKFYPPQDELNKNQNFFQDLQKIIKANRVKGLIIGYPIKDNKPTQHAYFVESLVKFMYKKNILSDLPCTFVNEAYSTFEAWRFLEMLQVDEKNYNPRFANNKKVKLQIFFNPFSVASKNKDSGLNLLIKIKIAKRPSCSMCNIAKIH